MHSEALDTSDRLEDVHGPDMRFLYVTNVSGDCSFVDSQLSEGLVQPHGTKVTSVMGMAPMSCRGWGAPVRIPVHWPTVKDRKDSEVDS